MTVTYLRTFRVYMQDKKTCIFYLARGALIARIRQPFYFIAFKAK